ncbi:MAG: aminoacetone oxidase family FAD-binding enzyme [Lachnospiraceae bacterium]|nr:aminoacetone oxidase family FAD-binding enzyme [Lachnospiraceae bacterium]
MAKKVLIIGGGASGMAAAYTAARCGASVTLIDKKEQLGKKLASTGNGMCNFTNARIEASDYHTHHPEFMKRFVSRFSTQDALRFFRDLSILYTERDGYYYPANFQAQSVVSALTDSLKNLGVQVILKCNAENVEKKGAVFAVRTSQGTMAADAVILACGSEASVKDLYAFSAGRILKHLGIPAYPIYPSLTYLSGRPGDSDFEPVWAGVRVQADVSYRREDPLRPGTFRTYTEHGQLQLTETGISGIPVFQLSHTVIEDLEKGRDASVVIDFLPEFPEETLRAFFRNIRENEQRQADRPNPLTAGTLLGRWVPKKLSAVILRRTGVPASLPVHSLADADFERVLKALKAFRYVIGGHGSLQEAQAAQGGVDLSAVSDRFEVLDLPGLFITGELLDVDGPCGGYNLHFAWGSGIIAGAQAAGVEAYR